MRAAVVWALCTAVAGAQQAPMPAAPDLLREVAARRPVTLDQLLALALANSPALRAAEEEVRAARGVAEQAGLGPSPRIGYSGEHIRGGSYGGGEQGGFVEQEFLLGGKLGLRRAEGMREAEAETARLEEARATVRAEVSIAYSRELAAAARLRIREEQAQLAADALDMTEQQVNLGEAGTPELLGAQLDAAHAQIAFVSAQRAYLAGWGRLVAATGGGEALLPAPVSGELTAPPRLNPRVELARQLRTSPALDRARREVAAAEARVKVAEREWTPDLTVRAGAWWSGEQLPGPLGGPAGPMAFGEASLPLPLWNRNQGGVAAARAERDRAQAQLAQGEAELRGEAEPAAQAYSQASWEADRLCEQLLPLAQKAVEGATESYNSMQAPYQPVLTARSKKLMLEQEMVAALEGAWAAAAVLQNLTPEAAREALSWAGEALGGEGAAGGP